MIFFQTWVLYASGALLVSNIMDITDGQLYDSGIIKEICTTFAAAMMTTDLSAEIVWHQTVVPQ